MAGRLNAIATGSFFGWRSGLSWIKNFKYGDTTARIIDLRQHFVPPRSGKYQLKVLFSESNIQYEPDLAGLIVFEPEPISVVVHNPNERGSMPSAADVRAVAAIAAAGGMFVFFSLSLLARKGTSASPDGDNRKLRYFAPKLRDAIWFAILLVVFLSAWYDHARQVNALWDVFPDAEAQWSIELAPAQSGSR